MPSEKLRCPVCGGPKKGSHGICAPCQTLISYLRGKYKTARDKAFYKYARGFRRVYAAFNGLRPMLRELGEPPEPPADKLKPGQSSVSHVLGRKSPGRHGGQPTGER